MSIEPMSDGDSEGKLSDADVKDINNIVRGVKSNGRLSHNTKEQKLKKMKTKTVQKNKDKIIENRNQKVMKKILKTRRKAKN